MEASVGFTLKLCYSHKKHRRPLTHDLIENIFVGFGIEMVRAVLVDVQDDVYYARLHLVQKNELGQKIAEIDARPSDCLVLAMMLEKPFYILRSLLDRVDDMRLVFEKLKQKKKDLENGNDEEQES